jgi:glycosyltransferase involved in cell wall biosynthesis
LRIGIYGNVNNYPFLLAEGLRKIGHEVKLVVTRSDPLHHPVKSGLLEWLSEWIYDASSHDWPSLELQQQLPIGPIIDFLMTGTDLVILNDTGPALHHLMPVPSVALLTGSDLTYYGSLSSSLPRRSAWPPGWAETPQGQMYSEHWEQIVVRQRAGIRRSKLVWFPWRGLVPAGDFLLDEIGVEDARRVFLMLSDTNRIPAAPMPPGGPLRILNGARLNWVLPMPPGFTEQDYKGTDILLRGFQQFLHAGGEGVLTLVEKGLHVAETHALAAELGIEPHIVWKAEMPVRAFYDEMCASHVLCCNLGSTNPSMNALAGMAAGRPVVADFRLDVVAGHYPEPWPVCQSTTPEQVAGHFLDLYRRPERRSELGAEARRFAENYLSPEAAARTLIDRLAAAGP